MPIRITGMNSGLDTESIIAELVKAKATKKDSLVKAQTKLQWKQDAWKELNSKVYSLYTKTLSNMRFTSDYTKKVTKVSNESIATVITGSKAVNGVQTLEVKRLAKTGYLTGAELQKDEKKASYTSTDKLTDLGVVAGSEVELKVNGETTKIAVDEKMTINDFVKKLQNAGLNASFDEKNQRFFISSKESGAAGDFSLTANDDTGMKALQSLGLVASLDTDKAAKAEYLQYCIPVDANGNEVTSDSDSFKEYKVKTGDQLNLLIGQEVDQVKEMFTNNKAELEKVQAKIDELEKKYKKEGSDDLDLASKEDLEKELAEKEKQLEKDTKLTSDERKALEKEIDGLKVKLEDRKTLDSLSEEKAELEAEIEPYKDYFELKDGKYEAKEDGLKTVVTTEVTAKAELAAKMLNGVYTSSGATRVAGQDAVISLNGAEFTSDSNSFEINGLTITANAETKEGEHITLTTSDDTDGIYDMIKGFLKEYNELINEMDKLYNADSSKGYEPLTDEEKDAMSEKEIEKWEEKIKDSILRRDSTLNSVATAMKQVMMQGVKMSDGSQVYLSEFGIGTLGYFSSKDNEKNAYHIDGDSDDASTATNADKLKSAIANDPDKVVEFFSSLSKNLYEKIGDLMKKTEYSSSFTLYDDVAMKDEYNDYTSKIKTQEQRIKDFEDRYYKKFSAMETALAKMSSKESAISGLLGM